MRVVGVVAAAPVAVRVEIRVILVPVAAFEPVVVRRIPGLDWMERDVVRAEFEIEVVHAIGEHGERELGFSDVPW